MNLIYKRPCPKVWILTCFWKTHTSHLQNRWDVLKHFHGCLHLGEHTGDVSEFSNSLLCLDPLNPQGDMILPLWWERVFGCMFYKPVNDEENLLHKKNAMLLYFQWNWVGFIVTENENGERFFSILRLMLMEKEICLAFTQMVKHDFSHAEVFKFTLHSKIWANVEVILFFAEPDIVETFLLTLNFKSFGQSPCPKHLHGSLHFRDHNRNFSKFSNFLLSLDRLNPQGDRILPLWWEKVFDCEFHKPGRYFIKWKKYCTGKENLWNLPTYKFQTKMTGESYNVYNAIYALAHTLHAMHGTGSRPALRRLGKKMSNVQPWQ
ncbi:hypothetical protein E2320_000216, partial [Naja naja]